MGDLEPCEVCGAERNQSCHPGCAVRAWIADPTPSRGDETTPGVGRGGEGVAE